MTIKDLSINGPNAGGSWGIRCRYWFLPQISSVDVYNCNTAVYFGGVAALAADRIYTNRGASGIELDGSVATGLNSCYFYGCIAQNANVQWNIHGAVLSDVYMTKCEGDNGGNGLQINGTGASNPSGVVDIHLIGFVCDGAAALIENMPSGTTIDINGGWFNPMSTGSAIRITASSGLILRGAQIYNFGTGIQIDSSCTDITVADCVLRGSLNGAVTNGISVSASTWCNLHNNNIAIGIGSSTPVGILITSSSANMSVVGNVIRGFGSTTFTSGVKIDTGCSNVGCTANIVDTGTVTAPYTVASALTGISIMPTPLATSDPAVHGVFWLNSGVLTLSAT